MYKIRLCFVTFDKRNYPFSRYLQLLSYALFLFCSKRLTLEVYIAKKGPRSACSLRSMCRLIRAYSVWILDKLDWSAFVYIQQTSYEDDIFLDKIISRTRVKQYLSVLYGNFSEKFPIIHKHSNTIQVLGRPFKLTDFLAALGLKGKFALF